MRSALILLSLFLPFSILFAQLENYKPAQLTLKDGRIIEGQASLESDLLLSKGVNFYVSSSRAYTYYESDQVASLQFTDGGQLYESIPFRGVNVLTGDSIIDTRLSKFLVGAESMRLYRVVLNEKEFYNSIRSFPDYMFYLKQGATFIPLSVEVSASENGNRFIKDRYKGVLRSLTNSWPESEQRTQKLIFKSKPMVNFFSDYFAYTYPDAVVETDNTASETLNVSHQLYGAFGGWAGLDDLGREAVYGLGYRAQLSDIGQSNALKVYFGVGVANHVYADPPNPTDQNFIESFTALKISAGINYLLVRGKAVQPYLHFGLDLNRISTTVQDVTPITRGVINPETGRLELVLEDCIKRPSDYKATSVVPSLGLGAMYGRLWVELTYDRFVIPSINDFIDDAEQVQPMLNLSVGYNLIE